MSCTYKHTYTYHGCEYTNLMLSWRYLRLYIISGYFEVPELPIRFEEPLDNGYVKVKGEIWFNQESGGYTGYPIYLTDPYCLQGGGYFDR